MNDDVRLERVRRLVQQRPVFQHALGGREIPVLEKYAVPAVLEPHVIIVGHSVVAVHLMPLLEEQRGKVKTDESAVPVIRILLAGLSIVGVHFF